MQVCKTCGAHVADDMTWCSNCGATLPEEVKNTSGSFQTSQDTWSNSNSTVDLNKKEDNGLNSSSGAIQMPDTSGTLNDSRFSSPAGVISGESNIILNIFSFLFPWLGLIFMAFVWKGEIRLTRKYETLALSTAIGSLLSIFKTIVSMIILFIVIALEAGL